MPKFQVVSLKPMSGTSKAVDGRPGRPYNMLIVTGIFTNDDGTMEVGETVFMERLAAGVHIPTHLKPGQSYTPVVSASSRQGKLQFEITELQPIAAATLQKTA